jgi:hypothetical protein
MTESIIDISKWQHAAPINYKAVFDAGVRAVIIEARDEDGVVNPYFSEDWKGFAAVGMGLGSYIFMRPDVDPESQANDLLACLKFGPVWADIEADGFTVELERAIMEKAEGAGTYVPNYVIKEGNGYLVGPAAWSTARLLGAVIVQHGTAVIPGIEGDVDVDTWESDSASFLERFRLKDPAPASPAPIPLGERVVAMVGCSTGGYWIASAAGAVYAMGGAPYLGGLNGKALAEPIVDIAAAGPRGYWLVSESGAVNGFGDARYAGGVTKLGAKPAA